MLLTEAAGWLEDNREYIARNVSRKIYNIVESYRNGNMPIDKSIQTMDATLGYIIDFLRDKSVDIDFENLTHQKLLKFEEGIASERLVNQIKLADVFRAIRIFRDEVWNHISRRLENRRIEAVEFLKLEKRINSFIIFMMINISKSYINYLGEFIENQEMALRRWEEVVKSASNIELKIPCQKEFAAIVRMQAEAIARRLEFSEDEIQDIKTAVGEACDNSIEHGVSEKGIDVHYHPSETELRIEVTDYGSGFEPSGRGDEPPDPFAERGRGLFLMKCLMDRVEVYSKKDEGTMLILSKDRRIISGQ